MSTYNFNDILTPGNTASGLADYFLYAPVSSFIDDGIQYPEVDTDVAGDTLIIKKNHSFKDGEGFIKVVCSPFLNELKYSNQGDPGTSNLLQVLDVFVPGIYPLLNEFVYNALHQPAIVLIPDCNSADTYYQLGNRIIFSWLLANGGSGTIKDGRKGWSLSFHYPSYKILQYAGAVYFKTTDYGSVISYSLLGDGNDLNYQSTDNFTYK